MTTATWHGPEIDADSLILQAISGLCSRGIQKDKAAYFQRKAHDLIGRMVEHLLDGMPDRPEVALVLWLLGVAAVPEELAVQFRHWADGNEVRAVEPLAEESGQLQVVKVKSALKQQHGTVFISPEGTYLTEEEERNRLPALNDQQKKQLIDQVPMFKGLDANDVSALAKAFEVETFLEGEEVVRHGENSAGMHIVVRGEGRVLVSNEVGTVKTGDSFGDKELLQGVSVNETIEAFGGSITTLHLDALSFKALGLKKKIKTMHRKKGLKARDGTVAGGRRASAVGHAMLATSEEDLSVITDAVKMNLNLREVLNLSDAQIEYVSREAYIQHFQVGQTVMEKGEYGHRFYIVNSGVFEVSNAAMVSDTMPNGTLKLRTGDSFGELALLYNAPRAATVMCQRAGSVWVLSRTTFKNTCRMKMEGRILEYSELIAKVEIFKNRTSKTTLANVCNALEERYFLNDELIVQEGAEADSFYVIFDGTCSVFVGGKQVRTLGRGDYFGERGLIERDVRTATVRVNSDRCTLLALDRVAFELMMTEEEEADEDEEQDPSSPKAGRGAGPSSPVAFSSGMNDSMRYADRLKSRFERDAAAMEERAEGSEGAPRRRASKVERVPMSRLQRIGVLGQGSFGFVSLERDSETGNLFALKAMSKAHILREQLKDTVANEKACMELMASDFVVRLIATYRDESKVYLLLDPCFGGELFEVYSERGDLFGSEPHAVFYAACTALGLEHIHSRRIVYRDLKLENCLLTITGYLKLTDLGIAKVCIGKTYTVCGTTDYFAPEVLRQQGHNRAVDWWALGVMVYIMMTGRSPFEAPDTMKIYRKIMQGFAKVSFPSDFPDHCMGMIRALCQKKPEERLTMGSLGLQNYKDHPWYRGFIWRQLENQTMVPPYVPDVSVEEVLEQAARRPGEKASDEDGDLESELDRDDGVWDDCFDMSISGEDTKALRKVTEHEEVKELLT